jgi:hypothetical protein
MKRIGALLPLALLCLVPASLPAQVGFGVSLSVNIAPPALPVYAQPPCPTEGYLWTPGYWSWDPDSGYYWVPGAWVEPPQVGVLWTPGYWGYNNGVYGWNAGYWGDTVGFYGGVNYGYGYGGVGFYGGRWAGREFQYNTAVVNVNRTVIRNVYVDRTVVRNVTMSRASFNGPGGVDRRPTVEEQRAMTAHHYQPTAEQMRVRTEARSNPQQRFSANHGAPPAAAMARVGEHPVAATNRPTAAETRAAEAQAHGTKSQPQNNRAANTRPEVNGRPSTAARNETTGRPESRT